MAGPVKRTCLPYFRPCRSVLSVRTREPYGLSARVLSAGCLALPLPLDTHGALFLSKTRRHLTSGSWPIRSHNGSGTVRLPVIRSRDTRWRTAVSRLPPFMTEDHHHHNDERAGTMNDLNTGVITALRMVPGSKLDKCRRLNISTTTYDRWRAGVGSLTEENLARLARISGLSQEGIRSGGIEVPEEC